MLNLRIVRGPLSAAEDETILREFNRLTKSTIGLVDFQRWIRDSPDGPAWHAILETDDSQLVGHFCLIPLVARHQGRVICSARTEYFFVHEDFRREKVRGFVNSFMPCGLLLLDRLYRHCRSEGWEPLIVSASEEIQRMHQAVGCRGIDFALSECLLVLKPLDAARRTPNLAGKQRAAIFGVGVAQRAMLSATAAFARQSTPLKSTKVEGICVHPNKSRIAFFEDKGSLAWRYPDADYVTFVADKDPHRYVIAKHGSGERYLRVCQWDLGEAGNPEPFLRALIREAEIENALGVRWSVYHGLGDRGLFQALRKFGFIRARRNRRILFHASDELFLKAEAWSFTDSFFCFDL
jgi:GNAT superfamily N-acetyltransferase